MSRLTVITDRALERAMDLASSAGDGLRHAGSNLRHQVAPHAVDWIKTGAAMGAVKTGGKVATRFARRNPVVTVAAAAAGVGLIAYALYRDALPGAVLRPVQLGGRLLDTGSSGVRHRHQYAEQTGDDRDEPTGVRWLRPGGSLRSRHGL